MLVSLILGGLTAVSSLADTPPERVIEDYDARRTHTARDAEAQVKLALWCEQNGLTTERLEHLTKAILADPKQALARALLGYVKLGDQWVKPQDVADRIAADAKLTETLAEYNGRRARAELTADDQWRLALWCEQNGLEPEAQAHFTTVVRLDPSRSAAWKRLGCKKYGNRWLRPEQHEALQAEARAQRDANQRWCTQLTQWRTILRGTDHAARERVEQEAAEVHDRRAVPAIWAVLVTTGIPDDQKLAVQLLGQFDTDASSRALAMLGLGAATPDLRRQATEALSFRDPHGYFGQILALLQRPLRYEVRPVGGPGSPGALFVEGQNFNRGFIYAPPAPDFFFVDTGYAWNPDAYGFEVLNLPGTPLTTTNMTKVGQFTGHEFRAGAVAPGDPRAALLTQVQANPANSPFNIVGSMFKSSFGSRAVANNLTRDQDFNVDVYKATTDTFRTEVNVPIGRMINEYRIAAAASQRQLESDVAAVESINAGINKSNNDINNFLNNLTGANLPPDTESWRRWYADKQGYPYAAPPELPRPTFVQTLPSPYIPAQFASSTNVLGRTSRVETLSVGARPTAEGYAHFAQKFIFPCCFGAGTPVQTQTGPKPIDELAVGDQVLTQDSRSGALAYQPILTVYHFRPTETYTLTIGDDAISTTPLHRFWAPARGWVMARDLKVGDDVRTLSGLARIKALEPASVQQVYNLEVAHDSSFFVGATGILVHDNSPLEVIERPFDAVQTSASN